MIFDVAYYSALGKRNNNEDAFAVKNCGNNIIAVVADGLGGIDQSEKAANYVAEFVSQKLINRDVDEELIEDIVAEANEHVFASKESEGKTTIAVFWTDCRNTLAANIGDSRIYQFRNDKIIFKSTDHSVPQLDVQAGKITPDQIRNHKDRNKLTRCIGKSETVSISIYPIVLKEGDRILLCSDGFWEKIVEKDMEESSVRNFSSQMWLEDMRQTVKLFESDNNTAVALTVNGD